MRAITLSKKEQILLLLFYHSYISRQAFLQLPGSMATTYASLKSLVQERLIKERTLNYKINSRPYKESCYSLSLDGLKYLKTEVSIPGSYYPELISATPLPPSLNISGFGSSHERIISYLKKSTVSVFSAMLGASYRPLYIYNGEDVAHSLGTLVNQGLKELQDRNMLVNPLSPYRFVSSDEMLKELRQANSCDTPYRIGREAGVLISESQSLLIYRLGEEGFGWSKWHFKAELPAYVKYLHLIERNVVPREASAACLVPNAKIFADTLLDKRKKRRADEQLGSYIHSLYVFPENKDGIASARTWLDYGESLEESLISAATKEGPYDKNNKQLFPLSLKGQDVYLSPYLSYKDLEKLRDYPRNFRILCLPWQEEYYRRIFPDTPCDHIYM